MNVLLEDNDALKQNNKKKSHFKFTHWYIVFRTFIRLIFNSLSLPRRIPDLTLK